jgi:hypothetical protein
MERADMGELWKRVNKARWKLCETLEEHNHHVAELLAQTAVLEVYDDGRLRKVNVSFLKADTSEPRFTIEFDAGKYRKADEEKIATALEKLTVDAIKRGDLPRAPLTFKDL